MSEKIWFADPTLEALFKRGSNTMVEHLGIEIVEIGPDFLVGTMPVDHRTVQPLGIVHGGANVVLAETLMSVAANMCLEPKKKYAVGLEINANHLRPVNSGKVWGVARPIHRGQTTHVWECQIFKGSDSTNPQNLENEKLSCLSRMTLSIRDW